MKTAFTRQDFEAAVRAALAAPAISGSKWRRLEHLYASEGTRVSGAVVSTAGNRRSRVRQILARRRHAGFGTFGMPGYGVLVLAGKEAARDADDVTHVDRCIRPALLDETGKAAERTKLAGVLILRYDENTGDIVPRGLALFRPSAVTDLVRGWYPALDAAGAAAPRCSPTTSPCWLY